MVTRRMAAAAVSFVFLVASGLLAATEAPAGQGGFVHGIAIQMGDATYHMAGAPDGPGGATDIPGHTWTRAGKNKLVGKHYNMGPFGATSWWSSDAPHGELLFIVHAVIDTWSETKAAWYASRGYVHYHELVNAATGALHPTKVVWLRHTARTSFTLDGGPNPAFAHEVRPGLDYEFMPNGLNPHAP